ncbi:MAG: hypothetical protein HYY22_09415 [Thaumarchaeota archaeon]|nr:hypothetical protein [Nitrososphaerota archaeon]
MRVLPIIVIASIVGAAFFAANVASAMQGSLPRETYNAKSSGTSLVSVTPLVQDSLSQTMQCQPLGKKLVTVTTTTTQVINGTMKEGADITVSTEQVGPEVQPPSQFIGPKAVTSQGNVTMEVTLSDKSIKTCDVLWLNIGLQGTPNKLWGSSELTVLNSNGSKVYSAVIAERMPLLSNLKISPPTERVIPLGLRAGPPGYPYEGTYFTDVTPGHYTLVLTRAATDVTLRIEAAFDVVE